MLQDKVLLKVPNWKDNFELGWSGKALSLNWHLNWVLKCGLASDQRVPGVFWVRGIVWKDPEAGMYKACAKSSS